MSVFDSSMVSIIGSPNQYPKSSPLGTSNKPKRLTIYEILCTKEKWCLITKNDAS